jgi:hypothetical protein
MSELSPDEGTIHDANEALAMVGATKPRELREAGGFELLSMRVVAYCTGARRAGIPPEQMLTCLKQALVEPFAGPTGNRAKHDMTRERIIELAITAYYGEGG